MTNKINITFFIGKIVQNIKNNKQIKEEFIEIYNNIENNIITIPGKKKTRRIITLTKPQLNRFNKIHSELQK